MWVEGGGLLFLIRVHLTRSGAERKEEREENVG